MNITGSLEAIEAEWEALKQSDNSRKELFDRMHKYLNTIIIENKALHEKIDNLESHVKNYVRDLHNSDTKYKDLQDRISPSPFVLVLIDGDSTLFLDDYVMDGSEGGHRAASDLNARLIEYFKKFNGYQYNWEIVVRLYVKLDGLASTYFASHITEDSDTVRAFYRGFNEVYPMFEAIDAGNDKEGADVKVKQNIKLFANNQHCKHIALAASSDTGYVGFLRPFVHSLLTDNQISLIESIPFPGTFKELSTHFRTEQFSTIFRSTKVPKERPYTLPVVSPKLNYATATQTPALTPPQAPEGSPLSSTRDERGPIHDVREAPKAKFNAKGQRLDDKLPPSNPNTVKLLKIQKLCNRHFLTKCLHPDTCNHNHDHGPLSKDEKAALMRIARSYPCPRGPSCEDRWCGFAHHCIHIPCSRGDECSFLHITDQKVAKFI